MNGDAAYDVIDDAVGIIYMINPVMARSALAGSMCGHETLPQASSISPDMRRIDDAYGNIMQRDATRPGQGASRHDRVNHIDDACGITATPMLK